MIIAYSLICNARFALLFCRTRWSTAFFAQQSQVKWLTISYVNKETHSDSNITTPVIVKNIICNNPNRDCNNFFTTITKLFTYFHDFIQIKRLFYNHFTQITDYASVYNIRKLNYKCNYIQGVSLKRSQEMKIHK